MSSEGPSSTAGPSAVEPRRTAGTVGTYLLDRFRIDTRSLAALRVALGAILVVDLLHRAGSIGLFYTDAGVYPVAAYEATYSQFTGLSVHAVSGALWAQALLFVCAGAFALSFLVGYRTRTTGLVSLVLLFSLQARNPAVLNGGDRLLRVLLAVSLLTPLGERFSIDALRRGASRRHVRSFGTAALLAQPLVVFGVNAIAKHRGETWYAGDALEVAMANDVMTILLGEVIAGYPTLLTAMTYGWVALLAGSTPLLLLTAGRLRALAVAAYTGAFLGMALSMTVGLFPLALIASVLPFLPAVAWRVAARYVPSSWLSARPATPPGPLASPPIEQRALSWLESRDARAPGYLTAYCRSLLTVLGALTIVWMLLFAAGNVSAYDVPEGVDYETLDQQRWSLYAPDPNDGYSWYVTEAELTDGTTVSAVAEGNVSFDRPPDPAAEYETFRHRKHMQAVRSSAADDPGVIATSYAEWACGRAGEIHGRSAETVTVYRLYQPSPINGTYEQRHLIEILEHECASSSA
ncbi:HTTM domain-containing protein [Natronomonas sp.]|uniref:HTTM domain-containing protein n=1 Tax=Natronomonas sp. TaxID=2184060 RepID=UPI002602F913|nr:HTTM domain-containing protein [Natronomonas sp.]